MAGKLCNYTAQELQQLLDESDSYADVLRKLGMSEHGSNQITLRKVIDDYGLDLTRINENRRIWLTNHLNSRKSMDMSDILKDGVSYQSSKLLKRLCSDGYKEYRCEICGLTEWMGSKIVLHLHHKDGKHTNNELSNLQILCPNCHSQTDNFAGKSSNKNTVSIQKPVKKQAKRGLSEDGKRLYDGYGGYLIQCPECKVNFMKKEAQRCRQCFDKARKIPSISKDELFEILKDNNYSSAAKILNVDRKTVSKWHKYYLDDDV